MPDSAYQNVQVFQTWHSSRTFNPGHPQIDPWMRDVLVSLQSTLNLLAKQIDKNTEDLAETRRVVNQIARHLNNQS